MHTMSEPSMSIHRWLISLVLLSLALYSAVFGADPSAGAAAAPSTNAAPVKLTIAVWGSRDNIPVRDAVLAAFRKAHPEIQVEVAYYPTDYMNKLQVAIAAGDAPDVFWINPPEALAFSKQNVLLDLTPYMQSDKEFAALKDSYFAAALSAYYFENSFWGLPYIYNPEAFFYNSDLFEAAGLKPPTSQWGQDELITAALKLTRDRDGNGVTDQWGFTSGNVWTHVWRAGGSIWDNDSSPRRSLLNSQEAIDGLRFFQDLIYRYRVRPSPSVWNASSERSLFLNGNAATYTEGAWTIREFGKVLPFTWGVTAFPRWRKQTNLAYVSGIAAFARTKHPREAWELVKFYAGPQAQRIQIEGQLATIPIMDMDIGVKPTPYTLGIFEAARAGRLEPPVLDMSEYRRIVGTGVGALLNNTQGPADAAAYMADNLTRLIQRLNR